MQMPLSATLVVLAVSDASVGNTIITSFNRLAGVPAVPLSHNGTKLIITCSKSYHIHASVGCHRVPSCCDTHIAKPGSSAVLLS